MLRRGVAAVAFPAIPWVAPGKFVHMLVTLDFRDDRRGRDRKTEAVAAHEAEVLAPQAGVLNAVDESSVGNDSQSGHRPTHRQQAGLQDVQVIHLGGGTAGDRRGGVVTYRFGQFDTARMRQNLGIVQTFAQPLGQAWQIENNGGGSDRASQWAATYLIDTNNKAPIKGAHLDLEAVARHSPFPALTLLDTLYRCASFPGGSAL